MGNMNVRVEKLRIRFRTALASKSESRLHKQVNDVSLERLCLTQILYYFLNPLEIEFQMISSHTAISR